MYPSITIRITSHHHGNRKSRKREGALIAREREREHPSVVAMVTTGSSQQTDFSPDSGQQGPGHAFLPFLVMEDLLDKLKLLNYDIQFVADLKMRPLNRLVVVVTV